MRIVAAAATDHYRSDPSSTCSCQRSDEKLGWSTQSRIGATHRRTNGLAAGSDRRTVGRNGFGVRILNRTRWYLVIKSAARRRTVWHMLIDIFIFRPRDVSREGLKFCPWTFFFFFCQSTVLSSYAEDGHQMYLGGSVVDKASTVGIGISPTLP